MEACSQAGHYSLTGNEIPEDVPEKQSRWAVLTTLIMNMACTLSMELRKMLRTNRLFPSKTRKAQRRLTDDQMKCKHPKIKISFAGNGEGHWWTCEACFQRLAYRSKEQQKEQAAWAKSRHHYFTFVIEEVVPTLEAKHGHRCGRNPKTAQERMVQSEPVYADEEVHNRAQLVRRREPAEDEGKPMEEEELPLPPVRLIKDQTPDRRERRVRIQNPENKGDSLSTLMKAQMEQLNTLKAQQQTTATMITENRQAMERMMGIVQQQGQAIQGLNQSGTWQMLPETPASSAAASGLSGTVDVPLPKDD